MWQKLKSLDLFKNHVSFFIHRRDRKTGEKMNNYEFGTKLGGVSTVFLYVMVFIYLITLGVSMYSTTQDIMAK
jgi:hypothetical protein